MAYVKGPRTSGFIDINEPVRFRNQVQMDDINPIGKTFYVRDTGNDGNTGTTPDHPFLTLEYAIHHAAGDWDVVRVLPNATYTTVGSGRFLVEAETPITITQRGLKLFGTHTSGRSWGNPMIRCTSGAGGASLINVNADDVEIAYLSFYPNTASSKGIKWSFSQATYGGHIHDCYFKGGSTAVSGISTGGASYDCVSMQIERCYFQEFLTSCIEWYAGAGAAIEGCTFVVPDAKFGIESYQQAAGKAYSFILNNKFLALGTTSVGIKDQQTPSSYMRMIDGNEFAGFADEAHCHENSAGTTAYNATWTGRNYLDGVLIDS